MIDKDKMACNKPKRTPSHPKSSHIVKACEDGKERVIRFGQQGVSGSPKKEGESESYRKRRESFKARHAKNIAKGKMSAAYWANKTKWAEGGHVSLEDLVEKYEEGGKVRPSLLSGFMQELNRLRSLQARQDAQEFRPENVERTRPVARRDDRAPTRANAAVQGRTDGARVAPTGDVYRDTAAALAERYGLPPNVFVSLVQNESAYNPNARSPVGAIGLAQLMPDTARELGVDPRDWRQNLEGGARYLRQQLDTFGSLPLALAAYNAGPGNVRKYNGIPPFRETQNYVTSVLRDAGVPGYAEGGAVTTYDPAAVEARIASMGKGYATGGVVQYDPAAVDQLVNTVREGTHV